MGNNRLSLIFFPEKQVSDSVRRIIINDSKANVKHQDFDDQYDPHITIAYWPGIESAFPRREVKEVLTKVFPLEITYAEPYSTSYYSICLGIKPRQALKSLHTEILTLVIPATIAQLTYQSNPGRSKSIFETFTTSNVLDEYTPHLTVLRKCQKSEVQNNLSALNKLPHIEQIVKEVWLADSSNPPLKLLYRVL